MDENALFITNSKTGESFCLATSCNGGWSIGGDFKVTDFSNWMSRQVDPEFVSITTDSDVQFTSNCPECGYLIQLIADRPGDTTLFFTCKSCGESGDVTFEEEDPGRESFREN
jgi:hypothetical protein